MKSTPAKRVAAELGDPSLEIDGEEIMRSDERCRRGVRYHVWYRPGQIINKLQDVRRPPVWRAHVEREACRFFPASRSWPGVNAISFESGRGLLMGRYSIRCELNLEVLTLLGGGPSANRALIDHPVGDAILVRHCA